MLQRYPRKIWRINFWCKCILQLWDMWKKI